LNPTLIRAGIVVSIALVCYSIGVITEQRRKSLSGFSLGFITAGLVFDISSTALMIIGSDNIPITVHGFLGYSALSVMLIDTILLWRFWKKEGGGHLPRGLNLYTRLAYGWWVIAYIAGAAIAMSGVGS
jgi:EamA domain-containing membrane protein RarD